MLLSLKTNWGDCALPNFKLINKMNFQYYRTKPLVIVILVLTGLVNYLLINVAAPVANYFSLDGIRLPSSLAIVTLILILYNQYAWKWPLLKLLVKVPNIGGRYKGEIDFEWEGVSGSKECVVEIFQTASSIKVCTYYNNGDKEKTSSRSIVETIKKEDDEFFNIYLFYHNAGTKENGKLDSHEGANVLRYHPATKKNRSKLIGHYFTNRKIQTRGTIEVEFKSKKLKGKF